MTKTTGYNNSVSLPTVGTTGHMLGYKSKGDASQTSDLEKLKRLLDSVCPINKNVPTIMSEQTYITACLKFRAVAEKDRGRKTKAVVTTPTGFKSSNKRTCLNCKRGLNITKGLPFEPPVSVTFKELEDIPGREQKVIKPKRKYTKKWDNPQANRFKAKPKKKKSTLKGNKLSVKDVVQIRKMYDAGGKLIDIHKLFPQVGREAISRVANRKTFKEI